MPLRDFLDAPDWSEPPDTSRWESLFDPAQPPTFGSSFHPPEKKAKGPPPSATRLPRLLRRYAPADDRRILLAYWQHLLEQGPDLVYDNEHPQPDPAFFELMAVVHAASHSRDLPLYQQAAYPFASIYLLRKYLAIHRPLREALSKAITRGSGSMKWSTTTILHRMQVVIDLFLRYHGWVTGGPLRVYPAVASWEVEGRQDFAVQVRITPAVLPEGEDGIVADRNELNHVEEALAWVLWALFAYAEDLGLKRAPFW